MVAHHGACETSDRIVALAEVIGPVQHCVRSSDCSHRVVFHNPADARFAALEAHVLTDSVYFSYDVTRRHAPRVERLARAWRRRGPMHRFWASLYTRSVQRSRSMRRKEREFNRILFPHGERIVTTT